MHRRNFLIHGAATAATAALQAAPPRVRIAFLGGTHSHAFAKAQICLRSGDYDLAGIHEPGAAVLARYTAAGIRSLTREQILADRSIAAVAVESTPKGHFASTLAALEAGKHVHVEKPPAATRVEMRKLVDTAARSKLLLQAGYMWRYHPGVNRILEMVRNGWLGDVYLVRGEINTLMTPPQRPELGLFAGGQMFELGSHLIDVLARMLGRPRKITPFLRRDGRQSDELRDNTLAVFEYDGAMAMIHSAAMQAGAGAHRTLEVLGTQGTATLRPIEPPTLVVDLARPAGPYSKGPQTVPLPRYERYVDDLAEFAAAVRGEKPLAASLEQEMLTQELLLQACNMER